MRHSQPFRKLLGNYNANELEQIRNEKNMLSVDGERLAEEMSRRDELQNIDVLYSSHYVRAMCTAKYISDRNNILLNVDERFGERMDLGQVFRHEILSNSTVFKFIPIPQSI